MTKMFISLEGSENEIKALAFDDAVPMRSKAATPAYRCKVYRARLQQIAASNQTAFPVKFNAHAATAASR